MIVPDYVKINLKARKKKNTDHYCTVTVTGRVLEIDTLAANTYESIPN